MRICFISNFMNIHQKLLCDELFSMNEVDFSFVATESIDSERETMKFDDLNNTEYVVRMYQGGQETKRAEKLWKEADVIILGHCVNALAAKVISDDKIVFRFSERIFKKSRLQILSPRAFVEQMQFRAIYNKQNIYALCAGSHVYSDYQFLNMFRGRAYKWGYFIGGEQYVPSRTAKNGKPLELLWVGRQIWWKHPDAAIAAAKYLKNKGVPFHLTMIGNGDMGEKLRRDVRSSGLSDCVTMLPFLANNEVRNYMKKADVYLFPSDRNEGWGVVLSEAMACGCVPVADCSAGASFYLIRDGENGLLYNGSVNDLIKKIVTLVMNRKQLPDYSRRATETISGEWSPKNAAERLVSIIKALNGGRPVEYKTGPCSRA